MENYIYITLVNGEQREAVEEYLTDRNIEFYGSNLNYDILLNKEDDLNYDLEDKIDRLINPENYEEEEN